MAVSSTPTPGGPPAVRPPAPQPPPGGAAVRPGREALRVWATVLGGLAVFKFALAPILPYGPSITGALAVGAFLWVPSHQNRRHGREDSDYGLNLRHWKRDLALALWVMAVVFPLFVGGYRLFLYGYAHWLPAWAVRAHWVAPYRAAYAWHWRAPWATPMDFLNVVGGNVAVALGEEFFYRGYLLERLSRALPAMARLLGQPFGRAAVLETALFAAGHLLTPAPYRLGTFFPGLLFTWMALRSKGVLSPAIVHASSNILIRTLEASAFGLGH